MRPTCIKIDTKAIVHNALELSRVAKSAKLMAAVKANAYGHGALEVSRVLASQVSMLAVSSLEEAIELREGGITLPILLLEGVFEFSELETVVEHDLSLVVHSDHQVQFLKAFKTTKRLNIWLKLTTGMNRLGFNKFEFAKAYKELESLSCINNPIYLMSHFATADRPESVLLKEQYSNFLLATKGYDGPRSLANSAGIFAGTSFHFDWVRSGLALYGIAPLEGKSETELNLKPVMSFQSAIIAIQHCDKGDIIGYGAEFKVSHSMRVGVVAAGYGDGYPLHVKEGYVMICGTRAPIVGRISMDMLTIDLSSVPQASIGTRVELWGGDLSVRVVAKKAETISYDLLTRAGLRARKEILN